MPGLDDTPPPWFSFLGACSRSTPSQLRAVVRYFKEAHQTSPGVRPSTQSHYSLQLRPASSLPPYQSLLRRPLPVPGHTHRLLLPLLCSLLISLIAPHFLHSMRPLTSSHSQRLSLDPLPPRYRHVPSIPHYLGRRDGRKGRYREGWTGGQYCWIGGYQDGYQWGKSTRGPQVRVSLSHSHPISPFLVTLFCSHLRTLPSSSPLFISCHMPMPVYLELGNFYFRMDYVSATPPATLIQYPFLSCR
jgi:hypothetical protein